MRYSNETYPFGFLLGELTHQAPSHFIAAQFPAQLLVHPNTSYSVASDSNMSLFLVGEVIHPDFPEKDLDALTGLLLQDPKLLQFHLDKLIGRWACAWHANGVTELQSDASGMRSVYFADGVAGSHAHLVATVTGLTEPGPVARFRKLGCPGISTPYRNVWRLPPNVSLNIESNQLRRFFPTETLATRSIDESWQFALTRATTAALAFAKQYRLSASLTAGRDSRATLLALGNARKATQFFTYTRGIPSHDIDCTIAAELIKRLGLQHHVLAYAENPMDGELLKIIKMNTFSVHQHRLAIAYRDDQQLSGRLHVRSNMLEITRSNLFAAALKSGKYPAGLSSPEHLTDYYCAAGKMDRMPDQFDAFRKYYDDCDLPTALQYMSSWDLYFIEHRMGAWRSGLIEESDIAFQTINLFNSREILKYFYGTEEADRTTNTVLADLLGSALPQIADVPFNPKLTNDEINRGV